jgi:hypothetical protein
MSIKGDYGRKKKNRGNELILVIIHMHMEMSQGNSLYSFLKQTKMSLFFLLQNQKTRGKKRFYGKMISLGGGRRGRKVVGW